MSAEILYHGFGNRGYQCERTVHEDGRVLFVISQSRDRLRCPHCNQPDVERRGVVPCASRITTML